MSDTTTPVVTPAAHETLLQRLKTAFADYIKGVEADVGKLAEVKVFFLAEFAKLEAEAVKLQAGASTAGIITKAEHVIGDAVKTVEGWFSKDPVATPEPVVAPALVTEPVAVAVAAPVATPAPVEVAVAAPAPAPEAVAVVADAAPAAPTPPAAA